MLTATTKTTYVVTITSAGGCEAKDTLTVTPKLSPVTSITQPTTAATYTINLGQSVTLKASGANTYAWSPGSGLSGTTGSQITATPQFTTTYKVVGSYSSGCSKTDSITVLVYTTSVEDRFAQIGQVRAVSPNPAQDNISLAASFLRAGDLSISLHDLTGRKLASLFQGNVSAGDFAHQAALHRFAAGIYLVTWEINGAVHRQKLQIQ